jgi:hypothetical protein
MQQVLTGLSEGVPLALIARQIGVHRSTIHAWKAEDPDFAQAYEYARDLGWDRLASEAIAIADNVEAVVFDREGVPHPNHAAVMRAKVQIETRLKLLAKWDSGRYGAAKALKLESEMQTTTRHVLDPALMDAEGREALRQVLEHAKAQGLLQGPEPVDPDYEEEQLGPEEENADA